MDSVSQHETSRLRHVDDLPEKLRVYFYVGSPAGLAPLDHQILMEFVNTVLPVIMRGNTVQLV